MNETTTAPEAVAEDETETKKEIAEKIYLELTSTLRVIMRLKDENVEWAQSMLEALRKCELQKDKDLKGADWVAKHLAETILTGYFVHRGDFQKIEKNITKGCIEEGVKPETLAIKLKDMTDRKYANAVRIFS